MILVYGLNINYGNADWLHRFCLHSLTITVISQSDFKIMMVVFNNFVTR